MSCPCHDNGQSQVRSASVCLILVNSLSLSLSHSFPLPLSLSHFERAIKMTSTSYDFAKEIQRVISLTTSCRILAYSLLSWGLHCQLH